jgi:hypothetical protein
MHAERFIEFVRRYNRVKYQVAYKHIHHHFPDLRDFIGMLEGAIRTGQIRLEYAGNSTQAEAAWLVYTGENSGIITGDTPPT